MVKKLNENECRDVCTLYKYKVSVEDISKRFGVSRDMVYRIIKNDDKYGVVMRERKAIHNVKYYDKIHSKYGFGELGVGDKVVVEGDFNKVRISSYGFRKTWGAYFFVKPAGEGKVFIERYK